MASSTIHALERGRKLIREYHHALDRFNKFLSDSEHESYVAKVTASDKASTKVEIAWEERWEEFHDPLERAGGRLCRFAVRQSGVRLKDIKASAIGLPELIVAVPIAVRVDHWLICPYWSDNTGTERDYALEARILDLSAVKVLGDVPPPKPVIERDDEAAVDSAMSAVDNLAALKSERFEGLPLPWSVTEGESLLGHSHHRMDLDAVIRDEIESPYHSFEPGWDRAIWHGRKLAAVVRTVEGSDVPQVVVFDGTEVDIDHKWEPGFQVTR